MTISDAIGGTWFNTYDSKMDIQCDLMSGLISGTYSSTTGSTGTYVVLGATQAGAPSPQPNGAGVPVSLLLFWRSNAGGKGDPSWNYVSGMCGQLIFDGAGEMQLQVMHQLVATEDFAYIQRGWNSDKVIYTRSRPAGLGETPVPDCPNLPEADVAPQTVTWTCQQDPAYNFQQPQNGRPFFAGDINFFATQSRFLATVNSFNAPQTQEYKGLALSAMSTDPVSKVPMAVSLSGWIDRKTGLLNVIEMRGVSSEYKHRWASVRSRFLTFTSSRD